MVKANKTVKVYYNVLGLSLAVAQKNTAVYNRVI